MLHEFVIDPEFFIEKFDIIHEKFGFSKGRLIVQFPSSWRKQVKASIVDNKGLTPRQSKRIETWLINNQVNNHNKEYCLVKGERDYNPSMSWLENAEKEYWGKKPFHAILAKGNPHSIPAVITDDFTDQNPCFFCPIEDKMPKTLGGFIHFAGPLLQYAKTIIFVDPYFSADNRFAKPLNALIKYVPQKVEKIKYCTAIAHGNQFCPMTSKI